MTWSDIEGRVEGDAARLFDELIVTHLPRKAGLSPNHPTLTDDGRVETTFLASLDANPPSLPQAPRGFDVKNVGTTPRFDAVLTAWFDLNRPDFRRDDHVSAAGDLYAIADVHRDGTQRTIVYLNRVR